MCVCRGGCRLDTGVNACVCGSFCVWEIRNVSARVSAGEYEVQEELEGGGGDIVVFICNNFISNTGWPRKMPTTTITQQKLWC